MTASRLITGLLAVLAIALALWRLEDARAGLVMEPLEVPGGPPATLIRLADPGPAPVVVIAHGFAGSQQLMHAYAFTLARAGSLAVVFDFQGHGRNPAPMQGDITSIDGTTRLLMGEVAAVTAAARNLPWADGRLAFLGHSMASDIVVRQALEEPMPAATIAVSMFSEAVTAELPYNLLIIVGQGEPGLRREALRALRLVDAEAEGSETLGNPALGTGRKLVVAPWVEHVGVLYAPTALRAARDWLDAVFLRDAATPPAATGGWIVLLLGGIVALFWPLASLLPTARAEPQPGLSRMQLAIALIVPGLIVPLVLRGVDPGVLPVLVADYLALHLGLWGLLTLALLAWWGQVRALADPAGLLGGLVLAAFALGVFGLALDRYAASFVPHGARLAVIGGLALGAVPAMLADALLTRGGRAGRLRVLAVRLALLVSLGLAVALDIERLFFLLIILPVIVLFFAVFGTMGGWVGRRAGPLAPGLGLGLVLAWSLGVTFPLIAA